MDEVERPCDKVIKTAIKKDLVVILWWALGDIKSTGTELVRLGDPRHNANTDALHLETE
jgi:hypothetical protein